MKILLACIWTLVSPWALAEGVASMTSVTTENQGHLDFHTLAVKVKSEHGKTSIALHIKADEKHPFTRCSVTIFGADGKEILVQFDPDLQGNPANPVYFHVADHLVANVAIMYHLAAENRLQSHVFRIALGEISKLSKPKN